mgnify:CR=1 FL=1
MLLKRLLKKDAQEQELSSNVILVLNIYNNLTAAYYDVTLSSDGSYTVYTQVVDKAGNKIVQTPNNGSNWYYQSYKIDKTAPTCTTSKSGSGSVE